MSKLNFEKKNFRFPKGVSGSVLKSENDHLGMSDGIFFFQENKVDHRVFWGGIYWRLPLCCNHFNIISGSQSKVEKTEFSIVFSTRIFLHVFIQKLSIATKMKVVEKGCRIISVIEII